MALLQRVLEDHEVATTEDAITSLEMLAQEYLLQDGESPLLTFRRLIVTRRLFDNCYEAASPACI